MNFLEQISFYPPPLRHWSWTSNVCGMMFRKFDTWWLGQSQKWFRIYKPFFLWEKSRKSIRGQNFFVNVPSIKTRGFYWLQRGDYFFLRFLFNFKTRDHHLFINIRPLGSKETQYMLLKIGRWDFVRSRWIHKHHLARYILM